MLIPLLFTSLADLVSISQARRAAGFLPFAFAFAGGLGVLSRMIGPLLPPLALVAGVVFQVAFPGDFDYALNEGAPGELVWIGVVAGVAGIVVGLVRRGPPLESSAGLAAALFLLPVVVVGVARWTPVEAPAGAQLTDGSRRRRARRQVEPGSVVYSDPETSYRLAAAAPVYIAVAPPGHVADTAENRPYERARDARRFLATGDLSIPEAYGAEYLVVDRRRQLRPVRPRAALHGPALRALPDAVRLGLGSAPASAARRLDREHVVLLEIGRDERRELVAVPERSAGPAVAASRGALRRERAALGENGDAHGLERAHLADDSVAATEPALLLPNRAGARSARRGADTRARAPRPAC